MHVPISKYHSLSAVVKEEAAGAEAEGREGLAARRGGARRN